MRKIDRNQSRIAWLATLALIGTAGLVALTSLAQGDTPGYAISDIRVSEAKDPITDEVDQEHARLSFDYRWEGTAYPGNRRCTWTVYDGSGNVVGSRVDTLVGQAAAANDLETLIDVSAPAARAEVSCDSQRYDDPSGRFTLSQVRVGEVERGQLPVFFSASWQGSGQPAGQECVVTVSDSAGETIERQISFATPRQSIDEGTVRLSLTAEESKREFTTAEMSCTTSATP